MSPQSWPLLLVTQVAIAAAFCGTFLLPAVANLTVDMPPATWAIAADGVLGWSAILVAIAAALRLQWRRRIGISGVGLCTAAFVAIIALTVARFDDGGWQAYHTLLAGMCIAAWLLPIATRVASQLLAGPDQASPSAPRLKWSSPAARMFGIASILLAFWAIGGDPQSPWWTVTAPLPSGAKCLDCLARARPRCDVDRSHAARIGDERLVDRLGRGVHRYDGVRPGVELIWANILALALMAIVSVWIERRHAVMQPGSDVKHIGVGFHRFAAWTIVAALLLTTGVGLIADYLGEPITCRGALAWAACLAGAAAAIACLWDPAVRWSVACLYCVGLIAVGLYLDGLNLRSPQFDWALANALAAYSLATSALWSVRDRVRAVLRRCRHAG